MKRAAVFPIVLIAIGVTIGLALSNLWPGGEIATTPESNAEPPT